MLLRSSLLLFTAAFIAIIILADLGHADRLWEIAACVPYCDKLGHLLLVGTLTVLLNLDRRECGMLMLGSVIVLLGMSLEEASQAFFPRRSLDPYDALANAIGVICGEGLVRMLPRRVRRAEAPSPAWP